MSVDVYPTMPGGAASGAFGAPNAPGGDGGGSGAPGGGGGGGGTLTRETVVLRWWRGNGRLGSSGPSELVQSVVVDAGRVGDLVDHRDEDLLDQLVEVGAHLAQR